MMSNANAVAAVVFDLDGLMFNTEDVFSLAADELVRCRGKRMTRECHHAMLGRRPLEAFSAMVEMLDLEDPIETLFVESRQIFESLLDAHLAPMPGLFDLLNAVDSRQLPKGVATSSPRDYLDQMLVRYDLRECFQVTLSADDVTHGKPHPEVYLQVAAGLRIAPSQMLVLEDSQAGTESAAGAGACVVSVPNRHTVEQDFSMATHVVSRLDAPEVLDLLPRHS